MITIYGHGNRSEGEHWSKTHSCEVPAPAGLTADPVLMTSRSAAPSARGPGQSEIDGVRSPVLLVAEFSQMK